MPLVYYKRKGLDSEILIVLNLTPLPKSNYRIGVPENKNYSEIFNSDHKKYWGSGITNDQITTEKIESHGFSQSISLFCLIPSNNNVWI